MRWSNRTEAGRERALRLSDRRRIEDAEVQELPESAARRASAEKP